MVDQKLNDIVSHIDYLISELMHLRSKVAIEDGIHINIVDDEGMFAIEMWDTDQVEPRALSYTNKNDSEIDDERKIKECMVALNALPFRAHKKQIYWNSDISWDKLPENFEKLDQIYKIAKRDLSDNTREELKRRMNALYSVS